MQHRLELVQARTGTRDWQVKRRERTRQLIELGGLVVKAELVDLANDDRAMLYGAFLWMADKLRSDDGAHAAALWQRRGKRAFEAASTQQSSEPSDSDLAASR
nr:conjugal transfer protein TraD [Sphingopyxis witflariensis]